MQTTFIIFIVATCLLIGELLYYTVEYYKLIKRYYKIVDAYAECYVKLQNIHAEHMVLSRLSDRLCRYAEGDEFDDAGDPVELGMLVNDIKKHVEIARAIDEAQLRCGIEGNN